MIILRGIIKTNLNIVFVISNLVKYNIIPLNIIGIHLDDSRK